MPGTVGAAVAEAAVAEAAKAASMALKADVLFKGPRNVLMADITASIQALEPTSGRADNTASVQALEVVEAVSSSEKMTTAARFTWRGRLELNQQKKMVGIAYRSLRDAIGTRNQCMPYRIKVGDERLFFGRTWSNLQILKILPCIEEIG